MSKRLSIVFFAILILSFSAFSASLELFLPDAIYAVPGVEMNVYFENLLPLINSANYVFDVDCNKGINQERRWTFVPEEKDAGSYKWSLKVFDQQGLVCQGETTLIVNSTEKLKDKAPSILVIGDSLTAQGSYSEKIYDNCQENAAIQLKMIGSRVKRADKVMHEGYGGWTWQRFLTEKNSKFIRQSEKGAEPDFKGFLEKFNEGKAPDVITVMLGINDIFSANDDNVQERIDNIFAHMDKFLAELRKEAPSAILGVALIPPGAASQDAFGANYRCGQTRWQYSKNQFNYNKALKKKFAENNPYSVSLVPVYLNLDSLHNFPQRTSAINQGNSQQITRLNNGVHPSVAGYHQIGDSFYSWLINSLSQK